MPKDKGMAVMIGFGKPKSGGIDSDMDSQAREDAAQEIIDAITDKDPAALSSALKMHYELCQEESTDSNEEAEGEEY